MFQASYSLGVSTNACSWLPQPPAAMASKLVFLFTRLVMQPVFASTVTPQELILQRMPVCADLNARDCCELRAVGWPGINQHVAQALNIRHQRVDGESVGRSVGERAFRRKNLPGLIHNLNCRSRLRLTAP